MVGECVEWTGALSDTGYGCFYDGRRYATHRYAWEQATGCRVPRGKCVLHRCDNRRCVRYAHLWIGTKKQNSRDMVAKGRAVSPDTSGEKHGGAKLTDAAVREIRASSESGLSLAARFDVSPSLVSLVRKRKAWTHL